MMTLVFRAMATILDGLDALLPDWSIPDLSATVDTILGSSSQFMDLLAGLNYYFPVDTLLALIAAAGVLYVGGLLYHGVVYVLTKLHVLGGSSY